MRRCPVTGEALRREERHGVRIDVGDRGVWLDKGELFLITERERHAQPEWTIADLFRRELRPPVDDGRVLACPVCEQAMRIEKLHGVHVDWCREHGVWLDAGELEAMESNLRLDPAFVGKISTRLWELKY